MIDEFPYHDEYPAEGPWPGGSRYGYRVERTFLPREWSDADRERAYVEGVTLPAMDTEIREVWWDGPARYWVEVQTAALDFDNMTESLTQQFRTAQRWVYRTWTYTPPWKRSGHA